MPHWWLTGEASLEELLSDEIMGPVAASAGLSREQLRSSLAEVARRIGGGREGRGAGRSRVRSRSASRATPPAASGNSITTLRPGCSAPGTPSSSQHRAAMQPGHGAHQAEAQPVAGRAAAAFEPDEAVEHGARAGRAACRARYRRPRSRAVSPRAATLSATSPSGVYFSALSSRLAIACDSRWRSPRTGMPVGDLERRSRGRSRRRPARRARRRRARSRRDRRSPQAVAARAGFGLGDAEQRVEGAEQPVGLGDGVAQRLGIARLRRASRAASLRAARAAATAACADRARYCR